MGTPEEGKDKPFKPFLFDLEKGEPFPGRNSECTCPHGPGSQVSRADDRVRLATRGISDYIS